MSPEQYSAILAAMVQKGHITMEEAEDLLIMFSDGKLDDMFPVDDIQRVSSEDFSEAYLLLLQFLGSGNSPKQDLVLRHRQRARDQLRRRFDETLALLDSMDPKQWHKETSAEVLRYILMQSVAGMGRGSHPDLNGLNAKLAEQQRYLNRYAHQVIARHMVGRPHSEQYIYARSRQYGGVGYGEWFANNERRAGPGWVIYYVSFDDHRTCVRCQNAERFSPYLPGVGPMPGVACWAKGMCRCIRKKKYEPALWRQLRGY